MRFYYLHACRLSSCITVVPQERLQVTYVTMVPWGNETLRHHALGTPCAWPALNLLCNLTNGRARRHRWVTSETRKHKSTCGKAGDSLKSWRTALARMPEVWQRDAASRSLKETMVTYVTWRRSFSGTRAASPRFGNEMPTPPDLQIPALCVCLNIND